MDKITKLLQEHKQINNFSLGQIERATGVSRRQLSSIVKGEVTKPHEDTKNRLARFILETRADI